MAAITLEASFQYSVPNIPPSSCKYMLLFIEPSHKAEGFSCLANPCWSHLLLLLHHHRSNRSYRYIMINELHQRPLE